MMYIISQSIYIESCNYSQGPRLLSIGYWIEFFCSLSYSRSRITWYIGKAEVITHGNGLRVGNSQTWGILTPFLYEMQRNIATLAAIRNKV